MLGIKRLLNFYLDASIHVALAVLALYWTSVYLLNILPNYLLAGFLFFSTIGYYNLVKYGGHLKVPAQMEPTSFVMIRTLTLVSLFLTMVFSVLIDLKLYTILGILFVLGVLYVIPLFPQKKSLRSWGLLKIVIVGLVWTGTTVVLPVVDTGLPWHIDLFFFGLQRFVLVLILMIPFEIRDRKADSRELYTLPQRYGVRPTQWIGYLLILFLFVLTFMRSRFSEGEVLVRLGLSLFLFVLIYFSRNQSGRYYAGLLVEAVPIFYCAALWWVLYGLN
jgi:hypothetical protein